MAVRALERSAAELSLADTIKLQQRVQMLARLLRHKPLPDFPLLRELKAAVVRETIAGTLLRRELGRKSLFEGQDGEPCSVEVRGSSFGWFLFFFVLKINLANRLFQ